MEEKVGEVWKEIEGYEEYYLVSNFGTVKRKPSYVKRKNAYIFVKGSIIKPQIVAKYTAVSLSRDGNQKTYYLHRIIAKAFIPNPENKRCVNHKDADKLNNSLDNLEWCTNKENTRHAMSLELLNFGEKCKNSKLTDELVRKIRNLRREKVRLPEVAKIMGLEKSLIQYVYYGITWKHIK